MQTLLISVIAALIVAVIVALFRIRQLYLVVPKLFAYSSLSTRGNTAELAIINRGWLSEEDISIELDKDLNYEIIATTRPNITIENSVINVPRIPPRDDASLVLIVEGGKFDKSRIAIVSSRNARGKIIDKLEQVPPNIGVAVSIIFLILTVPVGVYYGLDKFVTPLLSNAHSSDTNKQKNIQGWTNLNQYTASNLYKIYGDTYFPVTVKKINRQGDYINLDLTLDNKTDNFMTVTATFNTPAQDEDPNHVNNMLYEVLVEPHTSVGRKLQGYAPKSSKDNIAVLELSLSGKDYYLFNIDQEIPLSK